MSGGLIKSVALDSPAARAGLHVGEVVTSVSEVEISDLIDWMWHTDDSEIEIGITSQDGSDKTLILERDPSEAWGVEFENVVFDKVRTCANSCAFCFMTQLPQGLRNSLYLRDDDFRLSFLMGNFVTLTNVTDDDVERIIEQSMAPLHVSFHALDVSVRQTLIGRNHQRGLDVFEKLVKAGIDMHVSIVLVPGVNDGEVLDETLTYLGEHRPQVRTVGIVPVAFTQYRDQIAGNPPTSFTEQLDAARVIEQVQSYQFKSRAGQLNALAYKAEKAQRGEKRTWVHLADEFYINAKAPFPTTEWYDGFNQYENGIGIVLNYVTDIKENYDAIVAAFDQVEEGSDAVTIVTGQLSQETMLGTLSALRLGGKARLLPVKNLFFGGNVTVTGLLSGKDIIEALSYDHRHLDRPTTYLVPTSILNSDGLTLDDMTADDIKSATEANLTFIDDTAAGLIKGVAYVANALSS